MENLATSLNAPLPENQNGRQFSEEKRVGIRLDYTVVGRPCHDPSYLGPQPSQLSEVSSQPLFSTVARGCVHVTSCLFLSNGHLNRKP